MRIRKAWLLGSVALGLSGWVLLSWSRGQEQPGRPPMNPKPPAQEAPRPAPDLSRLSPLQRQFYLSAQWGADWLYRANRPDGRFMAGYLPALQLVAEGDHYLRQVGAAAALARAARFTGNERYLARARQAVLTLLLDTAPDPKDPRVRSTTLPSAVVNRLGAAGLLLLAIHELPSPGNDLLDQGEQLAAFIFRQQQPDGSLSCSNGAAGTDRPPEQTEGEAHYPGQALAGLMASQRNRPAPWKTEVVRKALAHYGPWWKAHPNPAMVPWHTAAYTEAFLLTKDKAFADAVFDMNDWLCGLQYTRLDPRHPQWIGGFMGFEAGKTITAEPQVHAAGYAESLIEACRVARQLGDVPHHERYRTAARGCLQFLTTIQFTEANTTHFADWYKPVVVGGFHAAPQDGNLRLDYTQQAVSALVRYLACVPEG